MSVNLRVVHQVADLRKVMDFFVKGFSAEIHSYEYHIDTHKQEVVFRLMIEDTGATSPPSTPDGEAG